MNMMFPSSLILILFANYCMVSISAEIQKDGIVQIGDKSLIVDPVTDLKWLHAVPASDKKPDAEHIFNQNLEMVASEYEPILNDKLPSGKRRLDEDASAEASVGLSRGSYIRDRHHEGRRDAQSKGNNVGFNDHQVRDTNQNYNKRSSMINNNGKIQKQSSRKTVAESRKRASKPYVASQRTEKKDDIFDDDDDDDDNDNGDSRANKRSDSDDSIFRDDDDENESSQDGSSKGYRGKSNLRPAAAGSGAGANPNNMRYGNSINHKGRNNNRESSSLIDNGNSDEDEDIDSTNLAKQKVLPAKESKKQKKKVKNHGRDDQITDRKKKSYNRRSQEGSSRSLQSVSDSDSNSNSNNNNNNNNNYGSEIEQDDAKSANSQHVSRSSGDLQTAAGHHHGKSHSHYYQYAGQPKKKAYKWGFKRGNHKHEIMAHGKGYKNKFHGSFKWHAKEKCGKKKKKKCKSVGKMTWEYKHHDKKKKHHH